MIRVGSTKDWAGVHPSTRGIGLTPCYIRFTTCIILINFVINGCTQSDRSNSELVSVESAIARVTAKPTSISRPTTTSTAKSIDVSQPKKQPLTRSKSFTGPVVTLTPIGPGGPRRVFLNDLIGTDRENVLQRLGRPPAGKTVFDHQRGVYMPKERGWYDRTIWFYRISGQTGGFPSRTRQYTITIFFDKEGKVSIYKIN